VQKFQLCFIEFLLSHKRLSFNCDLFVLGWSGLGYVNLGCVKLVYVNLGKVSLG
jgi:hypothetical protein